MMIGVVCFVLVMCMEILLFCVEIVGLCYVLDDFGGW